MLGIDRGLNGYLDMMIIQKNIYSIEKMARGDKTRKQRNCQVFEVDHSMLLVAEYKGQLSTTDSGNHILKKAQNTMMLFLIVENNNIGCYNTNHY